LVLTRPQQVLLTEHDSDGLTQTPRRQQRQLLSYHVMSSTQRVERVSVDLSRGGGAVIDIAAHRSGIASDGVATSGVDETKKNGVSSDKF
jgi:hypothetical protein